MLLSMTLLTCSLAGAPDLLEPVVIRYRMLFLKPGMEQERVEKILRLEGSVALPEMTLHHSSEEHRIGRDYTLRLDYRFDDNGRSVLKRADLIRRGKLVARVGAADLPSSIDPKLLDETIRAIQGRKP